MVKPTRIIPVVVVVVLLNWALALSAGAQAPVQYSGGGVKAVLGKTQASHAFFYTSSWTNLPGSALRLTVPQGTSDLFSLTFTGECSASGYLLIRVVAVVDGVGAVVDPPDDGLVVFCQANPYSTHTRKWLLRGGPGDYRFSVQLYPSDSGDVNDWTFEVVVYD